MFFVILLSMLVTTPSNAMMKWVKSGRVPSGGSSSSDSGVGDSLSSGSCASSVSRTASFKKDRRSHRKTTLCDGIFSGGESSRFDLKVLAYKAQMESLSQGNLLLPEQQGQLIQTLFTHFPFPLWPQDGLKALLSTHPSAEAKILRTTMALTELLPYWPVFDSNLESFQHHVLVNHTFGCPGNAFLFWEMLHQCKFSDAKNWLRELENNVFTQVMHDYVDQVLPLFQGKALDVYPAFDWFFRNLPYPSQVNCSKRRNRFFEAAPDGEARRLAIFFFAALAEHTIYNPTRLAFGDVCEGVLRELQHLRGQGDPLGTYFSVTTGDHFRSVQEQGLSLKDKDAMKRLLDTPNDAFSVADYQNFIQFMEKVKQVVALESDHRQQQQKSLEGIAHLGFAPAAHRLAQSILTQTTLERQTEAARYLHKLNAKKQALLESGNPLSRCLTVDAGLVFNTTEDPDFQMHVSRWYYMMEAAKQGYPEAVKEMEAFVSRGQIPLEDSCFQKRTATSALAKVYPNIPMIQLDLQAYQGKPVFDVLQTWCRMDMPAFDASKEKRYPWFTFQVGESSFLVMPESVDIAKQLLSTGVQDLESILKGACGVWKHTFFKAYPLLWGLTEDAFVPEKPLPRKPQRSASLRKVRPQFQTLHEVPVCSGQGAFNLDQPLPAKPPQMDLQRGGTLRRALSFTRKSRCDTVGATLPRGFKVRPVEMEPLKEEVPVKKDSPLKKLKRTFSIGKSKR